MPPAGAGVSSPPAGHAPASCASCLSKPTPVRQLPLALSLADIQGDKVSQLAGELGGDRAVAQDADVAAEEDIQRLAATALDTFGGLDVWCSNAGELRLSTGKGKRGAHLVPPQAAPTTPTGTD